MDGANVGDLLGGRDGIGVGPTLGACVGGLEGAADNPFLALVGDVVDLELELLVSCWAA